MRVFILATFFLVCSSVKSQLTPELERQIDSLKNELAKAETDTMKIIILSEWDSRIYLFDDKLDVKLNERVKKICEKNLSKKLTKKEYFFFSQKLGHSLSNLGNVFDNHGDIAKAISNYRLSLKIYDKIKDLDGKATALNNIGNLYSNQMDTAKALYYFKQSMDICQQIGDKEGLARTQNNISSIYHAMGNYQKAIEYSTLSLKLRQETGNKRGVSISLNNLGSIYAFLGEHKKAIENFTESLKLKQEVGDNMGMAICYLNLGISYGKSDDLNKAIEFEQKALNLAQDLGLLVTVMNAGLALFKFYTRVNDYKQALFMHELYIEIKDSLNRVEGKKELVRQEFKYEYEKKAAADSVRVMHEKELTTGMLKQEQTQRYILYAGLCLAIIFAIFIFNRFRIIRKQKEIIESQKQLVEKQKELVEAKQREVMDSIHYAKRIQEALLPSGKSIGRNLDRLKKID